MAKAVVDANLPFTACTDLQCDETTTVTTILDSFGGNNGMLTLCSFIRDGDKTIIVGLASTSAPDEPTQCEVVAAYMAALRTHSTLGGYKHELTINTIFGGATSLLYWSGVLHRSFPDMAVTGRHSTHKVHDYGFRFVRAALSDKRISVFVGLVGGSVVDASMIDFQEQCRRMEIVENRNAMGRHDVLEAFYTAIGFGEVPLLPFFGPRECNAADRMTSGETTVTTFVNSSGGSTDAVFSICSFIRDHNTIIVVGVHTEVGISDARTEHAHVARYFAALKSDAFLGDCKHVLMQDGSVSSIMSDQVATLATKSIPTIKVWCLSMLNRKTRDYAFKNVAEVLATGNVTLYTSIVGVSPAALRASLRAFDDQCGRVKADSERSTMVHHDLLEAFYLGLLED